SDNRDVICALRSLLFATLRCKRAPPPTPNPDTALARLVSNMCCNRFNRAILVIKMEDYSKHTPEHLDKIFDFLNVARLSSKNMQEISSATNENTRKKGDRKIGDMFPETRKLLRDFYNSHNNKLGRLLGQQFNYNRDEQGMSF
ncbi:CHSTF-like protein, partial [Mya arenaria]